MSGSNLKLLHLVQLLDERHPEVFVEHAAAVGLRLSENVGHFFDLFHGRVDLVEVGESGAFVGQFDGEAFEVRHFSEDRIVKTLPAARVLDQLLDHV